MLNDTVPTRISIEYLGEILELTVKASHETVR